MPRTTSRVKLRAFWELVRSGLSPAEAGMALGVSGHRGRAWFRDAGGVKPRVSKPTTDGPRPRLSFEERVEIQVGVGRNESIRSIAKRLRRAASTIKYELDVNVRNHDFDGRKSGYRRKQAFGARQSGKTAAVQYNAVAAHDAAARRAQRPKERKLAGDDTLREEVQTRLGQRHSPTQIAARLRLDFPDDPEKWVSHEAIYQSIYVQGKGALRRELHQCLRSGRAVRRPQHQHGTRRTRIRDMVNISERPADVTDRAVPGHWESQWCCQAA